LSPLSNARFEIVQPILIDADGGAMPGTSNAGFENAHREIGQHALATIILRPRAKVVVGGGGGVIEIALRRGRIVVAFTAEEAADVTPVFAQQRVALVFRMALKKDELGAPLRVKASTPAAADRVSRR
jgi:hypothetical protein